MVEVVDEAAAVAMVAAADLTWAEVTEATVVMEAPILAQVAQADLVVAGPALHTVVVAVLTAGEETQVDSAGFPALHPADPVD